MTTVAELAEVLADLAEHHPKAKVERNAVGNLVFVVSDNKTGYIELLEPEWRYFPEEES